MTPATIYGAPEGFDALLLTRRAAEHQGTLLHVARDDTRLSRLADLLAYFAPDLETLRFPAWDCLPYDRVSPNPAVVSERIATLSRLLEPAPARRIVLTTVNALVQRVPPCTMFAGASLTVAVNGVVPPEDLVSFLEAHGYGRADTVMEPGEYAVRGGIIDIFPSGAADPVRLDLFGDTVESIRRFDAASQRSTEKLEGFSLRPVSELSLDKESVARFRTAWRDLFGQAAARDPIYEAISEGRRAPGMEHWMPLFHDELETLLDYLPAPSVSFDSQVQDRAARRGGAVSALAAQPTVSGSCCLGCDAGESAAIRIQPIRHAGWRGGRGCRRTAGRGVHSGGRQPGRQHVRSVEGAVGKLGRAGAPHLGGGVVPRIARAHRRAAARTWAARRCRGKLGRRRKSEARHHWFADPRHRAWFRRR
jgi:transcription-repair coupling factor (superfamily II helicase)